MRAYKQKFLRERGVDGGLDYYESRGPFCKILGDGTISNVHAPDPTAKMVSDVAQSLASELA